MRIAIYYNQGSPEIKNMKKNLLAGLFASVAMLCCAPTAAFAEEAESEAQTVFMLKVVHTDGSEVKVPFSNRPEIVHTGTALKLTSTDLEMEYADGELDHFTVIEEKASGIAPTIADQSNARTIISDTNIIYTGGTPGAMVTVVAINGQIITKATLDADGSAVIPFAPEKGCIYVINSGKTTFKILKK